MRACDQPYAVIEVVDGDAPIATLAITGDVPDLFVVDALSRLELAARRLGWSVRVREPSVSLSAALALSGLPVDAGPA